MEELIGTKNKKEAQEKITPNLIDILEKSETPLHVKDIMSQLEERSLVVSMLSLRGLLASYKQRGKIIQTDTATFTVPREEAEE